MNTYLCNDGNCEVEIEADTTQEAAQQYVDDGEWGEIEETSWVNVRVTGPMPEPPEFDDASTHDDEPDNEWIKITLEPDEPECEDGEEHDWQSPIEIVGGIKENPGVWGHGGGVTMTSVCIHCGTERVIDTWAQDMSDGVQGLESTSYEANKYADEVAALNADED